MIGEQADPVPGDPEEVARLGRELRRTAESIRKQADEIRALSRVDQWKSKAAKEFRAEAEEAEGKLRKAMRRYDAAADALGEKVSDAGCSQEYASQRAQPEAAGFIRCSTIRPHRSGCQGVPRFRPVCSCVPCQPSPCRYRTRSVD
ncbi:hypothetical protein [Streptomyces werraensis]|uniref:hypothetical protein n=1 Tax=Streptomyces werraensis TaxID=68284 RepID=UPI001CE2D662